MIVRVSQQKKQQKSERKDYNGGSKSEVKGPEETKNRCLVESLMEPCDKQNYRSAWRRLTFSGGAAETWFPVYLDG